MTERPNQVRERHSGCGREEMETWRREAVVMVNAGDIEGVGTIPYPPRATYGLT